MKLRRQTLLLIGLPLAFELLFVGLLASNTESLESAASRESHAKTVLNECESLRLRLLARSLSLTALKAGRSKDMDSMRENSGARNEERFKALRSLVANDARGKEAVEDYLETLRHLNAMLDGAQSTYIDGVFTTSVSNFLEETDLFEELAVFVKRVTRDIDRINAIYSPIVTEFRPEAAKQRTRLRMLIFVGVGVSILLSLVLAFYFGKNTVSRLETLMRKLQDFSSGKNEMPAIEGTDEIAELDSVFREMALHRAQADELKKAVQAMVSHDLRSPLASILLRLQLWQTGAYGELSPPMAKTVQAVESEIQRLVRLANELLDAERLESGKLELHCEPSDANGLILEAVQAVAVLAEVRQITVEIAESEEALELTCDHGRIVQVLINFLSNSIKFSPRGSNISVSVHPVATNRTRFAVRDQGRGLSPEQQARVFNRFVQVSQSPSERSAGTGLGLSICKQLVELHGGAIGVESSAGGGACFWFELPTTDAGKA